MQEIIPPAKPYFPTADIEDAKKHLERILTSGRLTLGEYTSEFEREFAHLVGVRHAVAVSSGTSALEIALRASNLKHGNEVVIPTNTFAATCTAVLFAGGRPVITDVSPKAMTLDSKNLLKAISRRTKGVIAVHIGGLICPEIDEIREICSKRSLFLLEDAAHAHGSRVDARQAGSLGLAGCFSFYPTKTITSGEGGMITTDSDELADVARILRDQGKEAFNSNRIVRLGYNWRMPEICAVLGLIQLKRLQDFINNRNRIAGIYDETLDALGIERVVTPPNQLNNYYKYTFYLPKKIDRDKFKAMCREGGVLYGGEVYWPPLHLQPVFRQLPTRPSRLYVAERWGSRMVNPPIFNQMTEEQAYRVMEATKATISVLG